MIKYINSSEIKELTRLIVGTIKTTEKYANGQIAFAMSENRANTLINEWLKYTFDPVDDTDEPNEATAFIQKFTKHKYELRDMYLNLTTRIIDHADKFYNLKRPSNKKRFITVHRIMVNGMGIVAKRKRTNPDTPKTDIDIESFVKEVIYENSIISINQTNILTKIKPDLFITKPIEYTDANGETFNFTFLELHLYYFFRSLLMDTLTKLAWCNSAQYGCILEFFGEQYRLLFKNKAAYEPQFIKQEEYIRYYFSTFRYTKWTELDIPANEVF